MEPLSANAPANTGSEEFKDPIDTEELNPTTHASIGAADETVGSTSQSSSWETVRAPDFPATSLGGQGRAATGPGQSSDTARATGSAMDGPPPPQDPWAQRAQHVWRSCAR